MSCVLLAWSILSVRFEETVRGIRFEPICTGQIERDDQVEEHTLESVINNGGRLSGSPAGYDCFGKSFFLYEYFSP